MQEHLYDYDGKTKQMSQIGVHSSPGGRSVSYIFRTLGHNLTQANSILTSTLWEIDYDADDLSPCRYRMLKASMR